MCLFPIEKPKKKLLKLVEKRNYQKYIEIDNLNKISSPSP